MNKLAFASAISLMFTFGATTAHAEAKNGVGLNAGLTSNHMSNAVIGNYQSSGLSLGFDYQFAVSENFSINPFLMSSGESASGSATAVAPGANAAHGIVGLQLRYWIGDIFVGGHVGSYSEALSTKAGNVTTSTTVQGGGGGLVAGWENPNGGMFVSGQVDSANVSYNGSTTKVKGVRLNIGYRWK